MRTFDTVAAAAATGLFMVALAASPARAEFTPIEPRAVEPTHEEIIEHIYGRNVSIDGVDFVAGNLDVQRLNDGGQDARLVGQEFVARAVARFSANSQTFGAIRTGGVFEPVFSVSGQGYAITGSGTIELNGGDAFGRKGNTALDSSVKSQNADLRDHQITYHVTGIGPDEHFLLFWEDLLDTPSLPEGRTSSDFNDLVVELTPGSGNLIPLPPAVLTGAITAGVLMIARRIRRSI